MPLQPDLSAERTTEQDIYFPAVSVSGVGLPGKIPLIGRQTKTIPLTTPV
jgi:hypothetical protein